MPTSTIDESLLAPPATPEDKSFASVDDEELTLKAPESPPKEEPETAEQDEKTNKEPEEKSLDEYGNEASEEAEKKLYTEDEVNERINRAVRERLARLEKNRTQVSVQEEVPQRQDYATEADWQVELENFIEKTLEKVSAKKQHQHQAELEQQKQLEFQVKLEQGMSKYPDFVEVAQRAPFTEAMTVAASRLKDPAGFMYTAAKRHADELQRIASISDPIGQALEVARLNEKMLKQKPSTRAPKPLSETKEDSSVSTYKDERKLTIEEQIAQFEARKLKKLNAMRR